MSRPLVAAALLAFVVCGLAPLAAMGLRVEAGDLGGLFGGDTGTTTGTGDLLGLGLGSLEILEVSEVRDDEGETIEGLRALSMRLFD